MRRLVKLLVVATVLAGLTALPAAARVRRVPTQIDESIGATGIGIFPPRNVAFEGSISSRKDKCLPTRTLRVTYEEGGKTVLFGQSATDESGKWKVTGDGPADVEYVFTVDKARRGNVVCGADTLRSSEISA